MDHRGILSHSQEQDMNHAQGAVGPIWGAEATNETARRISTLWIVVVFSMAFADIVGLMMPGVLQAMSAGQVGVPVTQGLLLVFAILLEVPIAMIFVSRILKPGPNRWANTVAAVVTSAFVVGGGSPYLHYYFFATVEIACMALIVWTVWTRRYSEATA